jgi:predicted dehydrogenase
MMIREFADAIELKRPALTDGEAGLSVLRILEATQRSIKADGANVRV